MSKSSINGLDDIIDNFSKISKKINGKSTKSFMKGQGKALKDKTKENAKRKVKKRTGKYLKGIKNGKVYEYEGAIATRVYSGARHSHLVEYGHKNKNGGYTRGKHIFEDTKKEFEDIFESGVNDYIDHLFKENGF